jgi:hypothetical protein
LKESIQQGYLTTEVVSPEILALCRPGHAAYQAGLWARVKTLKAMGIPSPSYHGFELFPLWCTELSGWAKIRSVFSTIKRVFVKKLYKPRRMESVDNDTIR